MSSEKQRLQIIRNANLATKKTPEQKYWRSYGNTKLIKEHNAITHITFNPVSSDIAVTSSARIQVFSSKTRQVVKTYSRFKETAYSGEYRFDGKLLSAGDSSGLVQIFDAASDSNSKNLLVAIQASTYPIHVVKFHPSIPQQLMTCSDDQSCKLYDISQPEKPLFDYKNHTDYVRSGIFIKDQPNLIATGCYDGYLRIFDTRVQQMEPVFKFNHGNVPIEDILSISQTSIMSAGGNSINVYDLPSNKLTKKLGNFTKDVTCMSLTNNGNHLLAGSLDGHVKIYDISELDWKVKFGWKFGSGVLSCGVSPNNKHFVAGLTSGLLSIRTKKLGEKKSSKLSNGKKNDKSNAYNRMIRGNEYQGELEMNQIDTVVKRTNKKLTKYEKMLNNFEWRSAFDIAFQAGIPKDVTLTILTELQKLNKIHLVLNNRNEESLEPFLMWLIRNFDDIKCVDILIDYLNVALNLYGELVETSPLMEELLVGLKKKIDLEIEKSKEANKISGMLQLLTN